MALFNAIPPQMAVIMGKYVYSGSCTDVIGGTMTAGALTAGASSSLITWSPAFVSAPIIIATINSGVETATSPIVAFTGVTVSNAYVAFADTYSPLSGATIGLMIVGECKL